MEEQRTQDWTHWRGELLAAIQRRDHAVMRRHYDELFPKVYRYVLCRLGGDHSAAEEVAGDALYHAFRDLERYDAQHPPTVWVLGIARYRLIDHFRKQGRKPVVELLFSEFDEAMTRKLFDLESEEIPDQSIERGELARVVEVVLSQLPSDYEQILRLRYLEEQPVKALAERLRTTPKAAEARLYRARNAFRSAFQIAGKSLCF
jgi:RNA polymerase sigma-70 factor (ECF subfamily)